MIQKSTLLTLLTLFCLSAKATYVPVAITGYNTDVIANGIGAPSASTTGAVDDANANTGFVFIAQDYQYDLTCTTPNSPYFLPTGGLITSTATPGLTWQLGDYSMDNALRLVNTNSSPATAGFVTPQSAAEIFLLAVSGGGASPISVTVNFTDGSTQSFSVTIQDWYNNTPYVAQIGRVNRQVANCSYDGSGTLGGPRLYQYTLALSPANFGKQISGITFQKTNTTGHFNLMAISINTPCAAPFDQPVGLSFTPGTSQVSGNFTPALSNPDGYLVVRYPAGALPADPVSATSYALGAAIGAGTVVYAGPSVSFTATGLFANTGYDFYVYAYTANANCGGGPVYNTAAPLMSNVVTSACGGPANTVLTIGPGHNFTTLTDAITGITATGISGPVVFELQSNYQGSSEPAFPITIGFNGCISPANTLTIRPAAGATGLSISSGDAVPVIDFSNASNIIIDGRPGGAGGLAPGNLQIVNTNTGGAAIRFTNDATFNTVQYCDLQGMNTSGTASGLSGVIYFGTAGATGSGNDNNTVTYNNIHSTPTGTPAFGISAYGSNTNAVAYNDNNSITYNNIYDYFHASAQSMGIKVEQGNSAWTISNNSFYQTVPRVFTSGTTARALHITPNGSASATMTPQASGFVISDNIIGGSAPGGTGSPMTMSTSTTALALLYMGMDISVGVGAATTVSNNIISNISFSTGSTSANSFIGINLNYGNNLASGNIIGDPLTTNGITITKTNSTTVGGAIGMRISGGTTTTLSGNTIAGIALSGSSATVPMSFTGINATGGASNTISGNTIGSSTVANSITTHVTSSGAQHLTGINVTGGTATTVTGNTIANLLNQGTSTTGQVRGIVVTASALTLTGNNIYRLGSANNSTGAGSGAPVLGMSVTTGAGYNITGNTIHSLKSNSATANVNVVGLFVSGSGAGNLISRNFIYALNAASSGTGVTISAIDLGGGPADVTNNMISLGYDENALNISAPYTFRGITKGNGSNSNFYHNSVYIGGTDASASGTGHTFAFQRHNQAGNDNIINNIFANTRSNTGGSTGKHYAVSFASSNNSGSNITGAVLNHNLYYAPGTGGVMGYNGADVASYTQNWIAGDVNSFQVDPLFVNPNAAGGGSTVPDLHISTTTASYAESGGMAVPSVVVDFDNEARFGTAAYTGAGTAADIGADEFSGIPGNPLLIKLTAISAINAGSRNRVDWNTAAEARGDYFELEHSTDARQFSRLAAIAARGNAGGYSYWHGTPAAGINYYRLKMFTAAGEFSYSDVVTATVAAGEPFTMGLFPNPATEVLTVRTGNRKGNATITITDATGIILLTVPVTADHTNISLQHIPAGSYLLRYTDDRHTETTRFSRQ